MTIHKINPELLDVLVFAEIMQANALDWDGGEYVDVRKEDFDNLMETIKIIREKELL